MSGTAQRQRLVYPRPVGAVSCLEAKMLCAMALASMSPTAAAQAFVVAPELWDRPRSAGAVMAQPAVRQAVELYLARAGSRLVVHHGAAHESQLAAEELRSWLVALAIEPARATLRGSLQGSEPLRIEVE